MSIYAKICWEEPRSWGLHEFQAACNEVRRGFASANTQRLHFELTIAERDEILALNALIPGTISEKRWDDCCMLADARNPEYDTSTKLKAKLGIA